MNTRYSKRTPVYLSALFLAALCGLFAGQCKRFDVARQVIVKTGAVSDITFNGCVATGSLLDLGESGVEQYGFAWSTVLDPDNTGNQYLQIDKTPEKGEFTAPVSGLAPETKYYLWAYASPEDQTRIYGDPVSFTTSVIPADLPEVLTGVMVNITPHAAEIEYNVLSDGGSTVTERGVCWNMDANPTIDQAHTNDGSGTGLYTTVLGDLTPATAYVVRAYAKNIAGVAYGEQVGFSTPNEFGELHDERDGRVYATILIGEQNWMAQNLNYGNLIDGTVAMSDDQIINKYCYEDNAEIGDIYGGLYTWGEMMNYNLETVQGICPDGWHVPSEDDWRQLELHLGMSENDLLEGGWRGEGLGGKLKVPGTEYWDEPNTSANNETGFSALGAGMGNTSGNFFVLRLYTGFWTSHPDMWARELANTEGGINRVWKQPGDRLSVRCMED
jgi:uncharacterized protein (TIGR02145 family)